MGTNLQLAEIRKIARYVAEAYREWLGELYPYMPEYPQEELDHAVANVLNEIHLSTLAKEIERETTIVKGD